MGYSREFTLTSFKGKEPSLHNSVFLADGCRVIGDVKIGKDSSLWYNVVCRGDVNSIIIGEGSNIQDNSVVHVNHDGPKTLVGNHVTVGHNVTLHGCTLDDGCLIGMGSCILDGAHVGASSFVAAGSLLTPGKIYPPRVLIQGRPAKVVRELTKEEIEGYLVMASKHYVALKEDYLKERERFKSI